MLAGGLRGSGQHPGAVLAGQAPADEVAQVEGCGPVLEPGVVLGRSPVAELETPPAAAGYLRDDALDVGPVLAVVLAQGWLGGPVRPGGAQQRVVLVQDQGAAVLVRGAAGAQRAAAAGGAEGHVTAGADGPRNAGRAGDSAGGLIDGEIIKGEP